MHSIELNLNFFHLSSFVKYLVHGEHVCGLTRLALCLFSFAIAIARCRGKVMAMLPMWLMV